MSNRTLVKNDLDNFLILRRFVAIQEAVERISSTFFHYKKKSLPIETPNYMLAIRERAMDIRIINELVNELRLIDLDNVEKEIAKRYPSKIDECNSDSEKEAHHG